MGIIAWIVLGLAAGLLANMLIPGIRHTPPWFRLSRRPGSRRSGRRL